MNYSYQAENNFSSASPVVLKMGKEKAIVNRHHWIFSGAVASLPAFENGALLPVQTHQGQHLGWGYFNRKASIIGRMLSFGTELPLAAIRLQLEKAAHWRAIYFKNTQTDSYRLINGEGDGLPGLVVDKYGDALVIQISTLGMDLLRPILIPLLDEIFKPRLIYEKSTMAIRKEEGLSHFQQVHKGQLSSELVIKENGLQFLVSLEEGQKTGFFLDHRAMRQQIKGLASERCVLNCFAYTGGFSVYAAAGGACQVDAVDISEKALEYAKRQTLLNHFAIPHYYFAQDVFNFLRTQDLKKYNLIILDPPAFAKKQKDVIPACRGYKDINRLAIQKIAPHSLMLTSSCSYFIEESLFQKVIFQAALEAKREVKILGRHQLAADHPINLYHPESQYLKSLLLYIE